MSDVYERAEQALDGITPGPWEVTHYRYTETNARRLNVLAMQRRNPVKAGDIYKSEVTPVAEMEGNGEGGISNPADAEFIAAAPSLVAGLLAACRRLEGERDAWMARAHEAAGASLAAQKWHGTHSERMESERDVARAERDEAIKARWRAQDTLARVRELADRYEVITPAILHHALQEDTDG